MSKIVFAARFLNIEAGNLEKFKSLATSAIEAVKGEAGMLSYDVYFSPDESTCVVLETYADSGSVVAHMTHMSDLLPQLIGLAGSFEFECFGNPSAELHETLTFPEGSLFSYWQGK